MIKLNNTNNINLIEKIKKTKSGLKSYLNNIVDSILVAFLITIIFAVIKSSYGSYLFELLNHSLIVFVSSSVINIASVSYLNIHKHNIKKQSIKSINEFVDNLKNGKEFIIQDEIVNGDIFTLNEGALKSIKNIKNIKKVEKMIVMDEKMYWCAIKQITESFIKDNKKHENNTLYLLTQEECINELEKKEEDIKKLCKVVDFKVNK